MTSGSRSSSTAYSPAAESCGKMAAAAAAAAAAAGRRIAENIAADYRRRRVRCGKIADKEARLQRAGAEF